MRAVTNTSPLIYLSRIGRLDLFRQYREVLIPEKVLEEIEAGRKRGHPEALDVQRLVRTGHARVVRVPKVRREWNLGPGEAGAIAVALRDRADEMVIDDRAAIVTARLFALRPP